jgi:hypothetical protein
MTQPDPYPSRGRAAARLAAAFVILAAAILCLGTAASRAQSGRKAQKPLGLPTEAPKPGDPAATKPGAKKPDALVNFVVMRYDTTAIGIDPLARDGVASAFMRRIGEAATVEVTDGGKGGRSDARDRAKKEEKAYVILFQLEEQPGDMSMGRADSRTLIIRTYVYTPKSGDLKFTDTVYQRPAYDSVGVGGVRLPVPTRRVERYPSQRELEQAARDAADRLLSRFQVTPPPENE